MKPSIHTLIIVFMLLIVILSSCRFAPNQDELTDKVSNELDKIHSEEGNEDTDMAATHLESTLVTEEKTEGSYTGAHPTIWNAYKKTLDLIADDLPIHDEAMEQDHKEAYDQVIRYFDELSSGYKEDNPERDILFELVKVEDITEQFSKDHKGQDFYNEDGRYYRLYYVVLGLNDQNHLVDQELHCLRNGVEIEALKVDGAWSVSPVR